MLSITSVTRTFGALRALNEVSFDVQPGRITGFVGANGAGKTTTMRIVLGVLAADSGEVTWHGQPLTRRQRRTFGYMPEERGLYPKMKVRDQIVYLGRLHGLSRAGARSRTDELLARLGIVGYADTVLDTLSLGNQQRVQIAAALAHDPPLLVLDEPFSGLDPIAVDVMAEVLRSRAAAGAAVLFSSHQLELVERVSDDLVIIVEGRIRAAGTPAQLRARHALPRFDMLTDGDAAWVDAQPGVRVVELDGGHVLFDVDPPGAGGALTSGAVAQQILRAALERGAVQRFGPVTPSLSDIFREVTP